MIAVSLAAMSSNEQERLNEIEAVIRGHRKSFLTIGLLLAEVRDKRLYRSTHSTFEAYTKERHDISYRRADQLITAAAINIIISNRATSERQIRPLAKIPLDMNHATNIMDCWNGAECLAEEENAALNHKHVQISINRFLGSAGTKKHADRKEKALSSDAVTILELREQLQAATTRIYQLEQVIADSQEEAPEISFPGKGIPESALARDLFSEGYRRLAAVHNPAMGGDERTFAELNNLKTLLGV
jgi:hypothetical protein